MAEIIQVDFPAGYAKLVAACEKNHGIEAARKFVAFDIAKLTDALIALAAPTTGEGETDG